MKQEKYKRRSVFIPQKQWELIRKLSQKKGVTMSEVIRRAVELMYPNRTV